MAQFEEASPICRGKNLSWETVLLFYNNMPRKAMPKAEFNAYTEERINAWTQTHSQIARQLAFYYEENGICYPRFTKEICYKDLFAYMQNWAAKYFIPNPYSPSLKGLTPTCLYTHIVESVKSGSTNLDDILDSIFNIKLSSHDKVNVYLSNFTNLLIDNAKNVSINSRVSGMQAILHPDVVYASDPKKYYQYFDLPSIETNFTQKKNSLIDSFQKIFYGAPGTGKSYRIKNELKVLQISKDNIFRTTFHPDSDYSTFVGAYKPTRSKRPLYGLFGKETVRLRDGKDLSEETITYKFIPQAFLNAYMQAYKKPEEKVYLIIEEINRGNCAQIFGDLFQLLDRDANGVSEYTIKADADLKAFLEDEMGKDSDAIKEGELCLPSNLYIYATMNTSDQSLFPIDSAFKRRWDWEYEPIKYKNTDWIIEIQDKKYSWVSFQKEVNKRIFAATNSEDKMLGDYFVNPNDGRITEKMLLNKILFYLWNDVCKDGEGDIFKVSDTEDVSFSELYGTNGAQKLIDMMEYLGVKLVREDSEDNEDDEDSEDDNGNDKNNSQYSINGEKTNEKGKAWGKGALVKRAVEIYCQNYPNLSANEIRDIWINTGFRIPHIVETEEDKQKRLYGSKDKTGRERCKPIELKNGETLYVSTEVGSDRVYNNFEDFLLRIKSKPEWGINIQEL